MTTQFELFWEMFFRKLPTKTKLHSNSKVSKSNYLAQNAGYPHIDYRYMPRKNSTLVALFIDLGNKEKNQEIFHRLLRSKDVIESSFGESLEWDPNPSSRNVKVQKRVTIVGLDHQDKWDDIQNQMIDAMIELEKAFREHIHNLQAG